MLILNVPQWILNFLIFSISSFLTIVSLIGLSWFIMYWVKLFKNK